jgi:ParB/RepB/Spo0J family partition protein
MTTFKQKILSKEIKRADAMKIRIQDLHEEPGFNLRIEDEEFRASIDALADHIAQGGQYPALEVRPRAEGGAWIVDGHRRRRAIIEAHQRGASIADANGDVWVPIVAFEGNDADRVARVITSAEGRALKPLEVAEGYKRLRNMGWDNTRIAQKVGKTPQHVAQLLTLADANSDVHQIVAAGGVSAAVAVDMVRKHGENAGKVLADEVGKARAQGKAKATAGTIKGKPLPAKVTAALVDSVDAFMDTLTPAQRLQLAQFEMLRAEPGNHTFSVDASALLSLMRTHNEVTVARDMQEQKARERANKAAQVDIEQAAA